MADTQLPPRAAEPERLVKCRRLDELLHRISTINNNTYEPGPDLLGKAYLGGEAPDYFAYKLHAPEGAKGALQSDPALASRAASPPAPPPHQDLPLDLSLKTDMLRRESVASAASTSSAASHSSEASGRRSSASVDAAAARRLAAQFPPSPINAVVEQVPHEAGLSYACFVCGQMFSLYDRLAKHVASRHRAPRAADGASRAHECDVCRRRFARSDMLTRHARLHTGVKPYACADCGQVFTRSDHLSTHQRTHTGEKPYKCPLCPYAACRRDMITRHMRTHTRPRPPPPPPAPSPTSATSSC